MCFDGGANAGGGDEVWQLLKGTKVHSLFSPPRRVTFPVAEDERENNVQITLEQTERYPKPHDSKTHKNPFLPSERH